MIDLNSVTLIGRLTRDAETRTGADGDFALRLTLAVNGRQRTADGWVDDPSYVDCVWYGKGAEAVSQYLQQGRQVAVQGSLRQRRWQKDGVKHSRLEVLVSSLQLLASRDRPAQDAQPRQSQGQRRQDDDLPF